MISLPALWSCSAVSTTTADFEAPEARKCDCALPGPGDSYQQPAWSDVGGWDRAGSYSTIQTAHLDLSGQPFLLGRGPLGVAVWKFSPASEECGSAGARHCGAWLPAGERLALSDDEGWSAAEFYETIQAADVDGLPGEELLARGVKGLFVWKFEGARWRHVGPVLTVVGPGWEQAQYYKTIQTGDVDGDGVHEVLGRDAKGLHVWKFSLAGWTEISLLTDLAGEYEQGSGWGDPSYYETIQTANLDGLKGDELLLRASDGVRVYQLRNGSWRQLTDQAFGALADSPGQWNQPYYYETIQTGDIDGDGRHELVARYSDGLHVWKLTHCKPDGSACAWDATGFPLLQKVGLGGQPGYGWDDPAYYRTIQTVDIRGDGQDEVLARGEDGLHTWWWQDGRWSEMPTQPLEAFAGPAWSQAKNYDTIQSASYIDPRAPNAPTALVLGRTDTGIITFRPSVDTWTRATATFPEFTGAQCQAYCSISEQSPTGDQDIRSHYSGNVQAAINYFSNGQITNQSSIDPEAWKFVYDQVLHELEAAQEVGYFFSSLETFTDRTFVNNTIGLNEVQSMLTAEAEKKDLEEEAIEARSGAVVEGVVGALGAIPEIGEVIGIGADIVAAAMSTEGSVESSAASLVLRYTDVYKKLNDKYLEGKTHLAQARSSVLSDYGFLRAVGALASSDWADWSAGTSAPTSATNYLKALAAGQRQYELSAWQTLSPAVWSALVCDPSVPLAGGCSNFKLPGEVSFEGYVSGWIATVVDTDLLNDPEVEGPPAAVVQRFLSPTSSACEETWTSDCGFGLKSLEGAIQGTGLWNLGCKSYYLDTSCFWGCPKNAIQSYSGPCVPVPRQP